MPAANADVANLVRIRGPVSTPDACSHCPQADTFAYLRQVLVFRLAFAFRLGRGHGFRTGGFKLYPVPFFLYGYWNVWACF